MRQTLKGWMTMTERQKWQWAVDDQDFAGDFSAWLALDAGERAEYESGAAGEPTCER
jgi:hypothetical protein